MIDHDHFQQSVSRENMLTNFEEGIQDTLLKY